MLAINSTLTKKELLQNLASVATETQDLIVEIQSLPTFLATPIAFTIFNYQISNYPRKIYWTSNSDQILEFLQVCQVDIFDQKTADPEQNIVTVEAIPEKSSQESSNLNSFEIIQPQTEYTEAEFVEKELPKKPDLDFNEMAKNDSEDFSDSFFYGLKNKISAEDLLKKDHYSPSSLLGKDLENFDINKIYKVEKKDSSKPSLAFRPNSDVLDEQVLLSYKSEVVNDKEEQVNTQEDVQPPFEQNLDNWLEKIEATRIALNGLKQEEKRQVKKPSIFLKTMQFTAAMVMLSAFVLVFYTLFPTNVYSVNVVPQKKATQTTIDLPVSKFLIQNRNFNAASETAGTGAEIVNLNQARGKVLLVNRSGGSISFNRNGIILISSNGSEYRQLAVSGDPGTYVIPARSNVVGGSVEISVQSVKNGTDFNLPKDSVLKVYNLNRDLIGGLFSGTVTEDINVSKASGKKIIQSQDLKKIQQENLLDLEQQSQTELQLIANETTFTDPKWYSLSEVIDVFTHASGDVAETVGATTTAKSKLYYLNQNLLEDELKKVNEDMSKIINISNLSYTGDFSRSDSNIQLVIDYQYTQKINIDENELVDRLNNDDFSKSKSDLKDSYPQITEIKKEEQGIRLPGVPARVNVNIDRGE